MATTEADATVEIQSGDPNEAGYRPFRLGEFKFRRDEYFVYIDWPTGRHVMPVDAFLARSCGTWPGTSSTASSTSTTSSAPSTTTAPSTCSSASSTRPTASRARPLSRTFDSNDCARYFEDMLDDWTNEGFDPFASPDETGTAVRRSRTATTAAAITRHRVAATRMVGLPGDEELRSDDTGHPVNRQFTDVPQDKPEIHAEPGFEDEVHSFNLFAYLSRSDVTWNPSVVLGLSRTACICPTTEEYILPIFHGNDRVEWFVQLTDEIIWDVEDGTPGVTRSRS